MYSVNRIGVKIRLRDFMCEYVFNTIANIWRNDGELAEERKMCEVWGHDFMRVTEGSDVGTERYMYCLPFM